jgi:hypothetical protein
VAEAVVERGPRGGASIVPLFRFARRFRSEAALRARLRPLTRSVDRLSDAGLYERAEIDKLADGPPRWRLRRAHRGRVACVHNLVVLLGCQLERRLRLSVGERSTQLALARETVRLARLQDDVDRAREAAWGRPGGTGGAFPRGGPEREIARSARVRAPPPAAAGAALALRIVE